MTSNAIMCKGINTQKDRAILKQDNNWRNNMKYYAGIGSRETPDDILISMQNIATILGDRGYTLRSGGAEGADTAFYNGAIAEHHPFEIFTHADATTAAISMAGEYHPNWGACNDYVKRLHARNCQILLGRDVTKPKTVKCIICWTPNGEITGGTGQALRMAEDLNITVLNLGITDPMKVIAIVKYIELL